MIVAHVYKVSTLADGKISVIFHVPFEHAENALALHKMMEAPVGLRVVSLMEG